MQIEKQRVDEPKYRYTLVLDADEFEELYNALYCAAYQVRPDITETKKRMTESFARVWRQEVQ